MSTCEEGPLEIINVKNDKVLILESCNVPTETPCIFVENIKCLDSENYLGNHL